MKRNMISISIGSILLVTVFCFALRPPKQKEDTLIVGMMSGWAPFMSINNDGECEGFDVDCAKELAKRLDKKLIIKDMGAVASCFIALEQGRVDMVLSGLDITQARLNKVAMVHYTGHESKTFNLIFWNVIPKSIQSLEDLQTLPNALVCVESGSAQELFLDQYPSITKKRMNSMVDIILDLRFGKSLAAVVEPRVARRFAQQNPQLKSMDLVLPQKYVTYGCGIVIKKNNHSMINLVTNGIASMKRDGTLKKLETIWHLEE